MLELKNLSFSVEENGKQKEILHDLNQVVSVTGEVTDYVSQSEDVVKNFSSSFSTVREKAEANKKAVVAITAELDKFKL